MAYIIWLLWCVWLLWHLVWKCFWNILYTKNERGLQFIT